MVGQKTIVCVAADDMGVQCAQRADRTHWARPTGEVVAGDEGAVDPSALCILKHGFQCGQVAVNVGQYR
jgi:hypothetical protein